MGVYILRYAFFQIISVFYIVLVMSIYFSKKKVMTLENYLYSSILFIIFSTLLFDIASTSLPAIISNNTIIILLNRIYLLLSNSWLVIFTYYTFVISSKRNQGYVAFKDNKEREYFKNAGIFFGLYLTIMAVCCFTLKLTMAGNQISGPALYITYVSITLSTILNIIFGITNYQKEKIKYYLPSFLLILFIILSLIIQQLIPGVLIVSTMMSFTTVIMYFTVENPDVNLIKELNVAKEEADKANNAKTEFLSNMSHEIRTPLNAIVGFSEALKEEDISAEAKDEVDDIIMSSNNLIEIVNGILDISKIESNSLEIVNEEYDSKKLFNEVISLGKARLASRPIEFKINIDKQLPPVLYGDYARLKQIVINLVTNATKYTKEGSISLSVAANNHDNICHLVIKVSDTGSGIKKENLDKLFTKFQKVDLNSNEESNGLGLTISKSLINLMNGTIEVESEFGKGSTFTVEVEQGIVPKTIEENEKEITEDKIEKIENKKVLVVDDNTVNLKVAVRLLQDYGIDAEIAKSGQECLNKVIAGENYDIIFMDDMMPKMTGTETFQRLHELANFKTPVIALTANAITGMKEKYLSVGFNDYLAKPIIKRELTRVINKFLSDNYVPEEIKVEPIPTDPIQDKQENKETKPEETEQKVNEQPVEEIKETEHIKEEPVQKEETKIDEIVEDEKEKAINETMVIKVPVEEVKEEPKEETTSSGIEPSRTKEYLESEGIDVNHGLELLGDMETYDMVLEEFAKNYETRINKIKDLKSKNDMPNYAIEVHAMKSDSKYLGFMTLADISYEHEMASKANDTKKVNDRYDELIKEADKIYNITKKYLGI